MKQNHHIPIQRAIESIKKRTEKRCMLSFPYPVRYINRKRKSKLTRRVPLHFLLKAITLTNLSHSELEEKPQPINENSIISCYLFGSSVNTVYSTIIKNYFFGLYKTKKECQVVPNDIDILCFTNGENCVKSIKSMSSWEIEVEQTYSTMTYNEYMGFDITFYPACLVYKKSDFLDGIRDNGVCLMGDNILHSNRYAEWSHDVIKDTINCFIPRSQNVTMEEDEKGKKEEIESHRKLDLEE